MKRAHSIGASVSETSAETAIEAVTVRANSRQPPDDAAHEQQRDEHGDQREADRQHREADLARAVDGRLVWRLAILDMTVNVLHDHDGVVDDEADRDGECHQR
jgi:hypothetical protein